MAEKVMLNVNKENRKHVYTPTLDEEETKGKLLDGFLKKTFSGSAMKMVMQALGNHKPSKEELNEIKAFIEAEPKMQVDLSFFEESRNDQMAIWWRIITTFYNNPAFREKHFIKNSDRKTLRFSWTYLF